MLYCSGLPAAAQSSVSDPEDYELSDTASVTPAEPEEEEEPPAAIIYNQAQPDGTQWQRATSDAAYEKYRNKREYVPKPAPLPKSSILEKLLEAIITFLISPAGRFLGWTIIILVVVFIAYRLLSGSGLFARRDKKAEPEEPMTGIISEESLLEGNWEISLREAKAAGNTRLVIRYSYMQILQSLQERGLIAYRPDKTNTAYYRELTEGLRQPFRHISRQYEYAWYGNLMPDAPGLDTYLQTYEGLKKSITQA
jgi:hypothetical protein